VTEVDENSLRTLLVRMRQEDPEGFLGVVVSTLMARLGDEKIVTLENFDDDKIRTSAIVVVCGITQTDDLIRAISGLGERWNSTDEGGGTPA
jgi:hypothetical protein